MLKNRSLRTAALLSVFLGLAPEALAAAETPQVNVPYVFETVDSFAVVSASRVELTGILRGESVPRTFSFFYGTSSADVAAIVLGRCDRMALLAMNKPGLYFFEMTQMSSSIPPPCRLTRR